ncbi:MAG: hypothetical protein P9M06_07700, partial [Candidatus Saelkia tenebricola]|nr:hypothetical protein [Candidatus Saelkia tenebricola]
KIYFFTAILLFSTSVFANSEEIPQVSAVEIKTEILQLQRLEGIEDTGMFGIILDEIFFWFLDEVNIKKYIADSSQGINKNTMLNSEVSALLFRNEDGVLTKVIYYSKYLFPLETRRIIIDFQNKNSTSIKINFVMLSGAIEKEIMLYFKKGETHPLDKEKNFIYWGQADVVQLQAEFNGIKDAIVKKNFIDPGKKELGSLGEILDTLFRFSKWMRSENVFIIRHEGIKDVLLQEFYADCFFTASNLSLVVLYDNKSEIESIFRAARVGEEIESRSMVFTVSGLMVRFNKYNLENSQPIQQEEYLIPYTKTESKSN